MSPKGKTFAIGLRAKNFLQALRRGCDVTFVMFKYFSPLDFEQCDKGIKTAKNCSQRVNNRKWELEPYLFNFFLASLIFRGDVAVI